MGAGVIFAEVPDFGVDCLEDGGAADLGGEEVEVEFWEALFDILEVIGVVAGEGGEEVVGA